MHASEIEFAVNIFSFWEKQTKKLYWNFTKILEICLFVLVFYIVLLRSGMDFSEYGYFI